MLNKLWVLVLCSALFAPVLQANAKSMTQFYGSQLYDGSYDFNDLRRSLSSDAVYDNRVGFQGLAAYGLHVNVKLTKSDSGEVVVEKQKVRQSVHKIAWKDDSSSTLALNACRYYHDLLMPQEGDDIVNLKITVEDMPKWRVLREPAQLRKTRHRIYFNQRAVRIFNKRIKTASDDNRLALLKRVRAHFKQKVDILYKMHDHLMEEHDLPWKPRRWVWADFAKNNAYCYEGASFNPEIWYEVKKEISRIEDKIKKIMEEEKAAE